MAKSLFNFQIEEDLKEKMNAVCEEMGLSMSAALTIFIKKVVREHRIPFEISADPFYSESNMRHLEKNIREANEGKLSIHELIED